MCPLAHELMLCDRLSIHLLRLLYGSHLSTTSLPSHRSPSLNSSVIFHRRYSSHQTISKSPSLSLSEPPTVKPAASYQTVKQSRYRKLDYLSLAGNADIRSCSAATPNMALGFQDKHILIGQVEEYNKRISLTTFHIKGNFTSDVSAAKN